MVFVRVFDGKRNTYHYRKELKKQGLRFSMRPKPHWEAEILEDSLPALVEWCFDRKLEIEAPFSKRSADYRKVFFEASEPNFGKDRYLCAYCGFPVRKEKASVDHLVSVKKAQSSRFYLKWLQQKGFESVNDIRNLVPCCKHCNSRKGSKAGFWLIRGWLGKNKIFWYIAWVLELAIFLVSLLLAAPPLTVLSLRVCGGHCFNLLLNIKNFRKMVLTKLLVRYIITNIKAVACR